MENNNVGALVVAINSAIKENKDLKGGFNEALTKYVTDHESEINNLDVFQSVKRKAIIKWLTELSEEKEKWKELLGDDCENINLNDLQNDNPQELDGVLLDFDIAAEIIRKFKMPDGEYLGKLDAEKAVNTFDGLLTNTTKTEEEQKKLDIYGFHYFINNIGFHVLSCAQFDIILKHVDTEKKKNVGDKILRGGDFWNFYGRLKYKEEPPQNLIDFLVNNMNFNKADSEDLALTITTLMYNNAGKDGFDLDALKAILNEDGPYKNFVETLSNTQDIQTKLELENLISSDDNDVQKFGQELLDNNLEIKINDKKFEVVDYKSETNINGLIDELAKEDGFDQWMKDVFNYENKNQIVIDSIDSLVSAKADAIKSFIRNIENQDLRKKYLPLLHKDNHELLSKMKLNNDTVELIMNDELCLSLRKSTEFNLDKLREFLSQWKNNVTDNDSPLQLKVDLSQFTGWFKDGLNSEQFASLIKLDIWDLKTKSKVNDYYLFSILHRIKDANVCDEFLTQMKENKEFQFKDLGCLYGEVFGQCLFKTIYELIRTSKNYDKNDPGAAIDDVLKNGDDYQWFRNGLKQFFAEYPQNAEEDNKTTLNIYNVLAKVEELKTILDQSKRRLKFDSNSECLLSVEEKKEIRNIDELAENINKILTEDKDIKKDLNDYVCKYFENSDMENFTDIKRRLIKLWLCQRQEKKLLPLEIKFELKEKKDDDLKPLDKVNLNFEAVSAIVNAFLYELREKLSDSNNVKNAINTFRILCENINDEPKKFPVSDFYTFIRDGFGDQTLSLDDFKTMLKYVGNNADDDQKFNGEQFLTFCRKFKYDNDNQSIEFINFMVENTDFSQLDAEGLALTIIAVMSTFAKNGEFDRELLENIFDGNAPYEKFAKALQKFNYKKLEESSILKTLLNSKNEDIKKFVDKLLENNLDITIVEARDDKGNFSLFCALVDFEEKNITELKLDGLFNYLASEADFPGSIRSYFDDFFEKFDINKLNSIKADVIKKLIENSKNRDTLKQRYANLLQPGNQDLLSTMKLNKSVVASIIDSLMERGKKIAEAVEDKDKDIELLGKFVKNLKDNMKDDNSKAKIEYNLSTFIKNFGKKLNKDRVNNLLKFGIWNFDKDALSSYNLHDILLKINDGCITDEFLKEIKWNVNFSKLYDPKDELVGECIFKTIYQLIRTSEKYDEKNPGVAIDDVLVNGTKYDWFRKGLKKFFEKARYLKDGMVLYAKDLKPREVLSQVEEFQQMLLSCKMKLDLDLSKECPLQPKKVNYDMESVASFVKAINKIAKSHWKGNLVETLQESINNYITNNKNKICSVQEFQRVKRKAIQYWWKNETNRKKSGLVDYQNFELPDDIADLDELDEIILSDQTAENIILAYKNEKPVDREKDIANAVDTFNVVMRKTPFDKAGLHAWSFSSFIKKNFPQYTLSSAQFDSMLKSFQAPKDKDKDKDKEFKFDDFVNICYTLKDHRNSLDQLANFLVTNLSFDNLNSQDLLDIIWIFCNNSCLQDGCSLEATKIREFLEGNSKCTVLTDALAGLDNIKEKLDLTKLKQQNNLSLYQRALLETCKDNDIKLEFKQSKERQQQLKLIDELGKDPNFDKFMKFVFTGRIEKKNGINNNNDEKEYKTTNERYVFFKENRIGNIEELKAARVNAIENFIKSSGDERYSSLLNKDSSKLLSKVKLKKDTVVSIMSCLDKCLGNHFVLSELNNNLINDVKKFFQDWIGSINNNNGENDKVKLDNLGNLISPFCCNLDGKLNTQQFDTITGWDIWNLEKNSLSGDNLCDILKNLCDRGISDEFLGKIDKNKSVNFEKLFVDADKSFTGCLFRTISQLIRTSKNYDKKNPGAAIDDVLVNGKEYGWFRDGLKTFFETAKNKNLITKNDDISAVSAPFLKNMLDKGARRLQFDINKIDTEESPFTVVNEMDGFVEFINKDKSVLKNLNDYIKGYFSKNEIKINNLNEFQNIKPNVIKSWWGNFSKNNSNLNDNNYGNFSLEGKSPEDLKKLNGVILNFDNAKTIVIKCKVDSRVTSKDDAEAPIDAFKNLLEKIEKEEDNLEKQKNQLSVRDVYNFIINNFGLNSLSLTQFSDMLKYVDQNSNDKVISGEMFLTLCEKFDHDKKLTEDLGSFVLKNVNFDETNIDGLVLTIIGLMKLEIMSKAENNNELDEDKLDKDKLKNVLEGISKHEDLGKIAKITTTLEPINLIQSKNTDVCDFAQKLLASNLKIEFSDKKLEINKCQYDENYKNSIDQSIKKAEQDRKEHIENLITELEKENGFDAWIKNVFDINKQNGENSFIGKIDNIGKLMSAKTDAIKKFISSTDELQKKYNSLLYGDGLELLSGVKLSSDTVKVILNNLNSFFTKEFHFQTGKTDDTINRLGTFLAQWTNNLKNGMSRSNLDLQIDLSNFIQRFQDDLNMGQLNKLIDLNVWDFPEKLKGGRYLYDLLRKIDGKIDYNFLQQIKNIDFRELKDSNGEPFGQCLFRTISQLIRTSPHYEEDNKENIIKAINDVLVIGQNYEWVSKGLVSFWEKNKTNFGKIDITNDGIKQLSHALGDMLDTAKMKLTLVYAPFDPSKLMLTAVKIDGEKIDTNKNSNFDPTKKKYPNYDSSQDLYYKEDQQNRKYYCKNKKGEFFCYDPITRQSYKYAHYAKLYCYYDENNKQYHYYDPNTNRYKYYDSKYRMCYYYDPNYTNNFNNTNNTNFNPNFNNNTNYNNNFNNPNFNNNNTNYTNNLNTGDTSNAPIFDLLPTDDQVIMGYYANNNNLYNNNTNYNNLYNNTNNTPNVQLYNTNVENQNVYKKLALYGFLPFLPTILLIYKIMTNKDQGIQKEHVKNTILSLCGIIPGVSIVAFLIAGALSRCEQTSQGDDITQDESIRINDNPFMHDNSNINMNDNYVPNMFKNSTSGRSNVNPEQESFVK